MVDQIQQRVIDAADLLVSGGRAPRGTDLPDPWAFDGVRRVYNDGQLTGRWVARAVNLDEVEWSEENPDVGSIAVEKGEGDSPLEATTVLLAKLSKTSG